jgi:hypothetical protein
MASSIPKEAEMQNKYTAILVAFGLTISGTSMASLVDQSASLTLAPSAAVTSPAVSPATLLAHWDGDRWDRPRHYEPWWKRDHHHHRHDRDWRRWDHQAPPPPRDRPHVYWKDGPRRDNPKPGYRW